MKGMKIVEQVLIGSLLGDGCITVPHRNAQYTESKKLEHSEYLWWKAEILGLFGAKVIEQNYHPVKRVASGLFEVDLTKTKVRVRVKTRVSPYLSEIRRRWYPDGKKIVPEGELQKLDALGLAVWYMDDGCYDYSTRRCVLCVDGFSLDGVKSMQEYFNGRWGLKTKVYKRQRLEFPAIDTDKFLNIVKPYIHPVMIYKLGHLHPANARKLHQAHQKRIEYFRKYDKKRQNIPQLRERRNARQRRRWKERYYGDPIFRANCIQRAKSYQERSRSNND